MKPNCKYTDLQPDKLIISKPTTLGTGGQICRIGLKDKVSTIRFQLPRSKIIDTIDYDNYKKLIIEPNKEFSTIFSNLKEFVLNSACQNSYEWFNKMLEKENIVEIFDNSNEITVNASNKTCAYFDSNGNYIENEHVKLDPSIETQAIFELTGIVFKPKYFGIQFKPLQIKLLHKKTVSGYSFVDSDTDSD